MKGRPEYRIGTRGLHRVGPAGNVLILGGFVTVGLASPSVLLKVGALAVVGALVLLSDEAPRRFLGSLRFVLLFALFLFVVQALSVRSGAALLERPLRVTDRGLLAGAGMALRFLLILTSSFLFVTVTDPDRLAHLFIRLGLPYRYGYAFILALRFVPFFRNELRTVREAQRIRGIRTSVRSLAGIRRAVRFTFLPVLVSGLIRVDSITMSMKGRAFGLHRRRSSSVVERWRVEDAVAALLACCLVAGAVLSRRFGWS